MKALSNRSAMFFMFVIYTMASSMMKCMLSFNNYHPNMEQQEHINVRKFQIKQKKKRNNKRNPKKLNYRLIFFLSPPSAHSE